MTVSGTESLFAELNWLSEGMTQDINSVVHDITVEAKDFMAQEKIPVDTGNLRDTTTYNLGFMKGTVMNISTDYAGFVNGNIVVTARPYTTTPFVAPTVDFINSILVERISKVITRRSR